MQTFFLAPTRQNVGLTSVSLGVVRALQRQGLRVGFAKPISQDESGFERSTHFAREICQVNSPDPLPTEQVVARLASGQNDDLLEDIVTTCMSASANVDVLVVEGLHLDASQPFAARLNADIVRSLHAEVILVTDASRPNFADDVHFTMYEMKAENCHVDSVVFNKAPTALNIVAIQAALEGLPVWGVIKNDPVLLAPRTLDVARYLDAQVLVEGEINTRRVMEVVVAARAVPEVINRLKPGALVLSAGDRDDVMLATALAASNGIQLAGLLLTHSTLPNDSVKKLIAPALASGLPVLGVSDDSFGTATRVSRIPLAVPADDHTRMNQVLDAVAEQLDAKALMAAVKVPPTIRMSPPAFRYRLIQKASASRQRIVLPEGDEPRTIRAAVICQEKGIAHCVLLGKRSVIESVAAAQGITLPGSIEIVDPDIVCADYVAPMVEMRKSKGLTAGQALEQLQDTVVLGTMMLAVDKVDGLVSGAVHTTASTVRPALQLIKTAPGSSIVSSVFFMLMPDQVFVYGDCAINTNPSAEQLAEIALQSADSAIAFGIDPKVAMISYSTGKSGTGADVDKVVAATEKAKLLRPDLEIDGPLQYDAASVVEVGAQKAPGSKVAGQATVFIFPDLNTGNTTYKAVQRSAGVISVGPMLQGLRKPVNDLSRGALVDDIVFTIALTAIQAQALKGV